MIENLESNIEGLEIHVSVLEYENADLTDTVGRLTEDLNESNSLLEKACLFKNQKKSPDVNTLLKKLSKLQSLTKSLIDVVEDK